MSDISSNSLKFFSYLECGSNNEFTVAYDIGSCFAIKIRLGSTQFVRLAIHPFTGQAYLAIPNVFFHSKKSKSWRHAFSTSDEHDELLSSLTRLSDKHFVPTGLFRRSKRHVYTQFEKINNSLGLPVIFGGSQCNHFATFSNANTGTYDISQIPVRNPSEDDTVYGINR